MIRHVSSQPGQDLQQLFRQMVFNVMIGNTDDHLKNFLMLHDDSGWRLSPAYDLVPNIGFNREHVLRIGLDNRPPSSEAFLAEAKCFGIKRGQQVVQIVSEIHQCISEWNSVFDVAEVPEQDAKKIGADINQRLEKTR